MSVPVLAASVYVYTCNERYSRVSRRLFTRGFSKKPSVQSYGVKKPICKGVRAYRKPSGRSNVAWTVYVALWVHRNLGSIPKLPETLLSPQDNIQRLATGAPARYRQGPT